MDTPSGVVLSREGNAWIRDDRVRDVALPLYQDIMIQPFMPSARGWLSGTGLRAKWDYADASDLVWNPQYLVGLSDVHERQATGRMSSTLKIGFRDVSRYTDVRSFQGAILPSFPCGNSAPALTPRRHLLGACHSRHSLTVSSSTGRLDNVAVPPT